MATATHKARTNRRASRSALAAPESVPMRFLIFEDNAGDYHWTLIDHNRESLARSPSFASHEDAENAARIVLAGAGSARLDRQVGTDSPLEIGALCDEAAARDDTDTEARA
jgi:uncharacterized protein YegP (UPF0339 family)